MTTKCIGNNKVEFADKYFPTSPASDPSSTASKPVLHDNPFAELKNANGMDEKTLQKKFIAIVDQHGLPPGLKMDTCKSRPDDATVDQDSDPRKIDAAIWRREDLAPSDNNFKPHWVDQLMPVTFNAWKSGDNCQDPYDDDPSVPGGVVVRASQLGTKVPGQIISYAELVFTVQQRLALFMLVVVGRVCRFLRWDHSGAVVTQAIDYYEDWEFFCDVLWRISQCSDEQLGIDPSAVRLSEDDKDFKDMDSAAEPHPDDVDHTERELDAPLEAPFTFVYVREMFKNSLDKQWPRYKLEVPDGENTRHFLVCKPVFRAKGLIGRGTRGYVALDCATGRFVWLKDVWRATYLLLELEGDILAQLQKAGIPQVPTVICHGDIRGQTTLTPLVCELKNDQSSAPLGNLHASDEPSAIPLSSSKRKRADMNDSGVDVPPPDGLSESNLPLRDDCPLRMHKHYRLVVEEVALPLSDFEAGWQLLSIINDCIWAHYHAATNPKTQRLHCDVSGGNILIYPQVVEIDGAYHMKWMGLLADWEMSQSISGRQSRRQPERVGTWRYMSVALLSRDKVVEISDELEAFLYVLLYHATRYLRSNLDDYTTANFLDECFDQYMRIDQSYRCGPRKLHTIYTGKLMVALDSELTFGQNLDDLLATLLEWFQAHYVVSAHLRRLEEEKRLEELQKPAPTQMRPPPPPPLDNPAHPKPLRRAVLKPSLVFQNEPVQLIGDASDFVRRKKNEPTMKQWENAGMVQEHAFIYQLIEMFLREEDWPRDDKVGDRIPRTWAKPLLGSTDRSVTKTTSMPSKRARY
ncbi:hypothetical protein C8T65DRAFT_830759 [Cerioporus squamosus]|nr:hypothetical protein C8T65DRAFT_830759 [Cerioporus squamosus]